MCSIVFRFGVISGQSGLRMLQRCITMIGVNENAAEYLKRITGEKSVRAIALRIGVAPTTISRQIESELRPELLVRICREYGLGVIPELVHIDFITEEEVAQVAGADALLRATDEQLAKEILRRVQEKSATPTLTEPMDVERLSDGPASDETPSNVVRFPQTTSHTDYVDERAVAHERNDDPNDSDEHWQ